MSITLEIRNARGVVVCTTNLPELAFRFVRERGDLGKLEVWEVTHTVTERQLIPATVTRLSRREREDQATRRSA